ncbi:MAG TPA: DUF6220 domain-containing protein [Candidatus Dormibacteraeota bacterium]|nr:DUF6220 domain-containing protein [Candidatus Dormibacteraeota bacterium]
MADQPLVSGRSGALVNREGNELARLARPAYAGAAWLFAILIPVQFFFAGTGMFSTTGFSPHMYLGLALHGLSGALIVFAVIGRLPRRALEYGVIQFVLIGLQVVLVRVAAPGATISIEPQVVSSLITSIMQPIHDVLHGNAGLVASLHAVNALAISGVAVLTVLYARRLSRVARAGASIG